MLSVTPFLWFETEAEDAMNFYASVFPRARVLSVNRAQGRVMGVEFELEGQKFIALNGRPDFTFNDSVSFFVACETQQEIDDLWKRLTADGGAPGRCGWLKDKFGLSWQITPTVLLRLIGDPDTEKAQRVMAAMLQMKKIEIDELARAAESVTA